MHPSLVFLLVLSAAVAAKAAPGSLPAVSGNALSETRQPASSIDPRLKALKTVPIQRPAQGTSAEEVRQLRQAEAKVWLSQAGKLRAYRENDNVSADDAREARQLEHIALINAENAGDETRKEQRKALLREIRTDQSLPVAQRCEAVARDKYFELQKQQMKVERAPGFRQGGQDALPALKSDSPRHSFDGRLAAYANIERSLIQEFSEAPNGYEGLLHIARDSSPEQGAAIIAELLTLEAVPENVKTQAAIMHARYALAGRSLSELAVDFPLTPDAETWLYTYAGNHRDSIVLAKMLADSKPDTVELIGLCLDRPGAVSSQGNPAGGRPPGRIIQDDGNFSAALVMTAPGLAYAIGGDGQIRTVNLLSELRAARMIANRERGRK